MSYEVTTWSVECSLCDHTSRAKTQEAAIWAWDNDDPSDVETDEQNYGAAEIYVLVLLLGIAIGASVVDLL